MGVSGREFTCRAVSPWGREVVFPLPLFSLRALSPWWGFRGQRKLISELPVWETSPLCDHPSDLWCREMSASSETDTVHVVNHSTSRRTTGAECVRKNNIYYVSDGTLSSRLINWFGLWNGICRFDYVLHLYKWHLKI